MKVRFSINRSLTNFADRFYPIGIPDHIALYNTCRINEGAEVTMEQTDHENCPTMMIVGSKIGIDITTFNRWRDKGYITVQDE